MLRRLILLSLAAIAVLAPAAAAQAPQSASSPQPGCPSFQVLNDDKVGSLSLKAGTYAIKVDTPKTLSCAQAADLFRQFLQDFDGRLSGGWSVDAKTATFSRSTGGGQSFTVTRTGAAPASGGSGSGSGSGSTPSIPLVQPATGGTCPATFQVLHDDHVGTLAIPAGQYRLNLVAAGRMTCDEAAVKLASFLQDYDGTLPRPWILDTETGTFLRGAANVGFQLEPLVGPAPSKTVLKLPGDGQPCPGTFQVVHSTKVAKLSLPAGGYLLVPRAGSGLTCTQVVADFRKILAAAGNALPSPWTVSVTTGTFTRGRGSDVSFRVKPASR